jgi:MoxR-like ATPase
MGTQTQQNVLASGIDWTCSSCHTRKPVTEFYVRPDGRVASKCRACKAQARMARTGQAPKAASAKIASQAIIAAAQAASAAATGSPVRRTRVNSDYKPAPDVVATFAAIQLMAADGEPAPNMLFVGPSGSGKTECARYLADLAGLELVTVDAPSNTEPESWFGTREVIVENGAPRTVYHPSEFALALARPCVLLIDEANRVDDHVRGILLAILADTRRVTNPITGETIERHPGCLIIMTGNVGLAFTGTYAVDPAFLTRVATSNFEYLPAGEENRLAVDRTGCTTEQAALFVRFANDTRGRAKIDPDFTPISTREVLLACRFVARGLDIDIAAHQAIINAATDDGGATSRRAELERIWLGIKPAAGSAQWTAVNA